MYDFTGNPRQGRGGSCRKPSDGSRFPVKLAILAAVVTALAAIAFIDESNQYDPARERERLTKNLESIRATMKEVTARKERIQLLDRQADTDPGVIHRERLPPFWQLPAYYDSVEEWHTAARRRAKRADEELKGLADREASIQAELASLPSREAKRVSAFRRTLNTVLGDLPPRIEE